MTEPASALWGGLWLPLVWTPEWGWHWDMVANYVVVTLYLTVFARLPLQRAIEALFLKLKRLVNAIQFTIPLGPLGVFSVDFSEYTFDDVFFDSVRTSLVRLVKSKQAEARRLKLRYQADLQEAKSPTEARSILEDAQASLEDLTDSSIERFRELHPRAWKSALARFKTEVGAEAFLADELKSVVEDEKKKEDPNHRVSLTKAAKEKLQR